MFTVGILIVILGFQYDMIHPSLGERRVRDPSVNPDLQALLALSKFEMCVKVPYLSKSCEIHRIGVHRIQLFWVSACCQIRLLVCIEKTRYDSLFRRYDFLFRRTRYNFLFQRTGYSSLIQRSRYTSC